MSNSKHRKQRKRSAGSSKTSKVPQAPLLFSNFGKKPLDLVEAGYSKDHKFSISTCSTTGAKLTSRAVKRGQLSTASVAAQYKYKDATINVIVDSKSPISTTLTLSRKFLPSLNISASLKLPKYDYSTISTTLTLSRKFLPSLNTSASLKLPKYDSSKLSASVGTSSLAFGIQTKYEIASRQFREIDAGFSMTKPNYDASITMGNKGDFLRASYIHYFDHKKKVAAAAVISHRFSKKENALTVGGSWIVDNITTVKARVDDRGKIMMLLQYGIKSKSCLTIASEFDTKSLNKIPGIGLAFSLVL
ncbi:hypothetical protein POPTR_001G294100v4 [Populus trichocarpa]|uniref:Uncharacterized protein n=1 Tax=Populus trichocarpa TaxID=3694 RepID=A0A3N7ECV0_POPTR|nr:hypothetical protein BDE02_01G263100 [Populus trichocarpa]RQO85536.1 hypothetical protein POPTR_001G294100v4 [Populus trichocarpa]